MSAKTTPPANGRPLLIPVLRSVQSRFPRFAVAWIDERRERLRYAVRGVVHEVASIAAASAVKGDLLAWSGSRLVRIPAGTNDHVLTADSTARGGIKWAEASGGGGGASDPLWSSAVYRFYRWSASLGSNAMVGVGWGNMSQSSPGGSTSRLYAEGAYRECRTNTAANSSAGYRISGSTSSTITRREWGPRLEVRFRTYSDISNSALFIGLWKMNGTVDNNLAKADYHAGLSYESGVDTYWMLDERSSTTRTKTSTGVTPAIDTEYLLILEWNSSTLQFDVTLNGSSVGAMATNLPAATDPLGIWAYCSTLAAGTQQGIAVAAVAIRTL